MMVDIIGLYLCTALTIFTVSIIFKETPIYRLAQHIFMGSAMGYGIVMAVKAIADIAWKPMIGGDVVWIIPIVIGLMLYTKFSKNYAWISRYPIAILVSTGVTLTMRTVIRSKFLAQITSTFINPFVPPFVGTPSFAINNIIVIVIVICTMMYFLFTGTETLQKNPTIKLMRNAAIYFMMFAFGAGFASTVVSRIALWVGRTRYLLVPEARPMLPVAIAIVVLFFIGKERLSRIISGGN